MPLCTSWLHSNEQRPFARCTFTFGIGFQWCSSVSPCCLAAVLAGCERLHCRETQGSTRRPAVSCCRRQRSCSSRAAADTARPGWRAGGGCCSRHWWQGSAEWRGPVQRTRAAANWAGGHAEGAQNKRQRLTARDGYQGQAGGGEVSDHTLRDVCGAVTQVVCEITGLS